MSNQYETTVLRDGADGEREIRVVVEYAYYPFCRGARDSLCGVRGAGPPLEPDEPAHVEIERVRDSDGAEVELTDAESEKIEEAIMEEIADRYSDYPEDDGREDR